MIMTQGVLPAGRRRWLAAIAALLASLSGGMPGARAADDRPVLVFAAASLKNALDEVAAKFSQETGTRVAVSYAASSALAKQIEQGAEADLFLSADLDWMDYLDKRQLIRSDSRVNLLGNRIVLVTAKDSKVGDLAIAPGLDLAGALGDGRLAMGEVSSVPAGKYGKAALEKLGVWAAVEGKLAQAENVRGALALVSRGEAPLGIVYQTDAAADPNVRIVGTFPEATHPPIIYPVALTRTAENPAAAQFLSYLRSPQARGSFGKQGFTAVGPPAS
jgi:molybdate transport system substrate-binding protein